MSSVSPLQPAWDLLLQVFGTSGIANPAFLLTAVVLGVYLPGIVFSIIDVFVTRRLTVKACWDVYWRAMKWYGSLYFVALPLLILFPFAMLQNVPLQAPGLSEFCVDLLLYFLLGDFVSYFWHRTEHRWQWYMKNIHYYHHIDTPPLSIWTAMVVHPVEGATVFFCFHIYGILFSIHPLTFAVGAFLVTAVNMITHCNYRLPVYDRIFANARCHDIHHASREPKNISVMLSICDRLFGTFQKVP